MADDWVDPQNTQPPIDPDVLYEQGMTHYRRRHWRQARESFEQLLELQPSRHGVETMLREVELFLSLESVDTEAADSGMGAWGPAESEAIPLDDVAPEPRRGRGVWLLLLVIFIAAAVVLGVYLATGPLSPDKTMQRLRNQMQSYLVSQQWCKSLDVATSILATEPTDPEAANGADKSKRMLYDEALDCITRDDLDCALVRLNCIIQYDPSYKDVTDRIVYLSEVAELDELYVQAREYLDTRACGEGIKRLQEIRALDPAYRPGTITDDLYEAFLCEANQWLGLAEHDLAPWLETTYPQAPYVIGEELLTKIRKASVSFKNALKERPDGELALLGQALVDGLSGALENYRIEHWEASAEQLALIYEQAPTYLAGGPAALYCDVLYRWGNALEQEGQYWPAIAVFERMRDLQSCDPSLAATRAFEVSIPLTPTPTFTATASPTATATRTSIPTRTPTQTPLPTPTATATATRTVQPTSPPATSVPQPKPRNTPLPRD